MGVGEVDQTKAPVGTTVGGTTFQELGVFNPPSIPSTGGQITVQLEASGANGNVSADTIGIAPAWATGGGLSYYEPEPLFQDGVQSTVSGPDVAFDGSISSGVTTYQTGYFGTSSTFQSGFFYDGFGTSLSSPCWAGILAVANQGRIAAGGRTFDSWIGDLPDQQETLFALYSLPNSDFHDVTTGYNGLSAGPGYDELTGLGTPVGNLLIPDLVSYGLPVGLQFSAEPATEVTSGTPFSLGHRRISERHRR